jgi:hypothetical protein
VSLEAVTADGVVLAYIARADSMPGETRFLTPDDCNLQVGHVVYPAGSQISRHMHLPVERRLVGTTEVILVQRGRCELEVFDNRRELVKTCELGVGDILIALGGGHGFRVLEDTVLLEVKQGPYVQGGDKERF